jgi:hypothetical protein
MIVRPKELANLCSIFPSIRAPKIPAEELGKFVRGSMLIDSYSNVDDIIAESMNAGLVTLKAGDYCLTKIGQRLGKCQEAPGSEIRESARIYFLKDVFLNLDSNKWCCGQFLLKFRVDPILETFVYVRNKNELDQDMKWLMLLTDINLIEVDKDKAKILPEHLSIVNDFLIKIRNPLPSYTIDIDNENNKIGALAESLAMEYEKARLINNALSYLAPLVVQVSKVDMSAGYDILSYRGTGEDPDTSIFIEVKGTRANDLRFIWSYNERKVAEKEEERYWIYCYINVDLDSQKADGPITIKNPLSILTELGYSMIPLDVCVSKSIP